MPVRSDLHKILLIGSGPIIIGQACEFDYSGTQACRALRDEGYEVILVNSNPATIMTDPNTADRVYIEPLTVDFLEEIIKKEHPNALLPTIGGQTALNLSSLLYEAGILERYNVRMIGANYEAIKRAEDRLCFRKAMSEIGLDIPKGIVVKSLKEARKAIKEIGFPCVIRPSYTLGGIGGGIAGTQRNFEEMVKQGLHESMIGEVLLEESLEGWKEYELEVMRDLKDNVVIICSIENLDPMGIHTGDSITVAPIQTLTDKEYQIMRDAAISAIRKIGVETGGSNVQFAVCPKSGRMVIIEINPRVSRSSALASKATGFPIAKIAAKLAIGKTLDDIPNDITKKTPASFEPTIDYCVVKIPRFTFEKFKDANPILTTSMKSVGEIMSIGRTFKEALQKGIRSLEMDMYGLYLDDSNMGLIPGLFAPNQDRLFYIYKAIKKGIKISEIHRWTKIDPWFLRNIKEIVKMEDEIRNFGFRISDFRFLKRAKEYGFSDKEIGRIIGKDERYVKEMRKSLGINPVFKSVDTCAGEFEAETPYYYSTYDEEDEVSVSNRKNVIILGSGPNRIGQGIEFDYCCCQGVFALREEGYEAIMVNCNPETVSTDYDISDRLYFEPMTYEDVMNIIEKENPLGIILQLGGQTPLKLAIPLKNAGVKILGTSVDSIDIAEDRERFSELVKSLSLKQPPNGYAKSIEDAKTIAKKLGFPVLLRPSYVLGGRAMEIAYDEDDVKGYIEKAIKVSSSRPILIDKFLEDAIEVDVDAISDGNSVVIGGVMEHIERAGIHSGDSAMVLPPHTLKKEIIEEIKENTKRIALSLNVIGLINIQFAVKEEEIYILEVNPRASRTIPFISKAIGVSLASLAVKVMLGKSLKELGFIDEIIPSYFAVKESVFPFTRFYGTDCILGPEMKSTGEVMGIADSFSCAYAKSQIAAGQIMPESGRVFVSVPDREKPNILKTSRLFLELGFSIIATRNTGDFLEKNGIFVEKIFKVGEGKPDIVDMMRKGLISLVINIPSGKKAHKDEVKIRTTALSLSIPIVTTSDGALATASGILALKKEKRDVKSIQEYHSIILKRQK
ncbi:MAG: carbamoyl-phosphate synthase large subunit [bacterium]